MCGAFAYAYGYCNGDAYCYRGAKVYSFTTAASHTAAAALRRTDCHPYGDSRYCESPYCVRPLR